MMQDTVLDVHAVSRRYGDRLAVSEAGFTLEPGGITCLLGPSGCGKSTLLRMIAGLEPVDAGEIRIGGRTVSVPGRLIAPEHRDVGLVFQDFALFPHLDVAANIGFGLVELTAAARAERVAALLARFHIGHLAHAWPHTLSGGEQQRVAMARALARGPELLLLDEPFSGLDGQLRADVRQAVLADLRATGATVLIVTHDPGEAMQIADRLILMSGGRVLQTGTPADCYLRPVSIAAARLLGEAVTVPARVESGVAHTVLGAFAAADLPEGAAVAMVRPEALRLDRAGGEAEVVAVRFVGMAHLVELRIGGSAIAFPVQGECPRPGEMVGVTAEAGAVRVFPAGSP